MVSVIKWKGIMVDVVNFNGTKLAKANSIQILVKYEDHPKIIGELKLKEIIVCEY